MRRAILFLTLVAAVTGTMEVTAGAQSLAHGRNPLSSMTFLPQTPTPLTPSLPSPARKANDKALEALTAQKLAALNAATSGATDCKMVREAVQGVDPAIRKPAVTPGGPSFSGRVIAMPSCAKQ